MAAAESVAVEMSSVHDGRPQCARQPFSQAQARQAERCPRPV